MSFSFTKALVCYPLLLLLLLLPAACRKSNTQPSIAMGMAGAHTWSGPWQQINVREDSVLVWDTTISNTTLTSTFSIDVVSDSLIVNEDNSWFAESSELLGLVAKDSINKVLIYTGSFSFYGGYGWDGDTIWYHYGSNTMVWANIQYNTGSPASLYYSTFTLRTPPK